jgi:hypothetical protein
MKESDREQRAEERAASVRAEINMVVKYVHTEIERKMQIFEDIKKTYFYCKSNGKWYWHDRDEKACVESSHGPFDTFLDMVNDAVEPYLEESE